jgi:Domain of unknown function (DUF4440)
MKNTLLRLLPLIALAFVSIRAADAPPLAALNAADDERVAATIAADKTRLAEIFSDDLRYAHSSGAVDSKASLTEALVSGRTKYIAIDYEQRDFAFPAPGIALMTGRAHLKVTTATGGVDMIAGFLAVWREEKGRWRLLAWQSCKLPAPAPPTSATK